MEMDLQRIDVKQLLKGPAVPEIDSLLVIFDRWRKVTDHPSDWVDLADYAHMPQGPGILIAGKRDTFSLNLNPPGPGLLTSVRNGLVGSLEERFREAFRRAGELNDAVLAEPEFPADLSPIEGAWEVFANDRLLCPSTSEMDAVVRPQLASALGIEPEALRRHTNPGGRLGYSVRMN